MNDLTDEQKDETQKRIAEFMKRYEALTSELQVDFGSMPMYVPNGNGTFATVVQIQPVDMKYTSQPSPFVK